MTLPWFVSLMRYQIHTEVNDSGAVRSSPSTTAISSVSTSEIVTPKKRTDTDVTSIKQNSVSLLIQYFNNIFQTLFL